MADQTDRFIELALAVSDALEEAYGEGFRPRYNEEGTNIGFIKVDSYTFSISVACQGMEEVLLISLFLPERMTPWLAENMADVQDVNLSVKVFADTDDEIAILMTTCPLSVLREQRDYAAFVKESIVLLKDTYKYIYMAIDRGIIDDNDL